MATRRQRMQYVWDPRAFITEGKCDDDCGKSTHGGLRPLRGEPQFTRICGECALLRHASGRVEIVSNDRVRGGA